MPALNLKDIRKDLHFPELRLPEMSRDDIAKALGEARKEMADVRRDLNEFRREIELPKVDVSRADVENVADDVARTAREAANDARKVSKEAAKVLGKNVEKGRKEALKAAQKAGIVKKPSRIPYVLGGFITLGLVGWALSNPAVKDRLRSVAQQARERIDEMRSGGQHDEEPHAFDAAEPAGVAPSPFSDAVTDSPFAQPPSELPEGLGATDPDAAEPAAKPARAKVSAKASTGPGATNGTNDISETTGL